MDKLPDIGKPPDWGLSEDGEFRVNTVTFGDGYSQYSQDGINSVSRSWNLSWKGIDLADQQKLLKFLVEKRGVEAFQWTIPSTKEVVPVRCLKYPKNSIDSWGSYSISAELTEDLNP